MSAGDVAVDAMIEHLRGLQKLPEDVVREAAEGVLAAAKKRAAAGTTADGEPWPAKKDGGRALEHAPDRLSVRILGRATVLVLKGVEVVHNRGTKRMPKRQILPDAGGGIPKDVADVVRKTAGRVFARAMGGG